MKEANPPPLWPWCTTVDTHSADTRKESDNLRNYQISKSIDKKKSLKLFIENYEILKQTAMGGAGELQMKYQWAVQLLGASSQL